MVTLLFYLVQKRLKIITPAFLISQSVSKYMIIFIDILHIVELSYLILFTIMTPKSPLPIAIGRGVWGSEVKCIIKSYSLLIFRCYFTVLSLNSGLSLKLSYKGCKENTLSEFCLEAVNPNNLMPGLTGKVSVLAPAGMAISYLYR